MLPQINFLVFIFFFSFAFTLGFQFPLWIWWSSVGHPRVHKVSPWVLLVMAISLLSMTDGSCMSVKCGRYLALPLHRSTSEVLSRNWHTLTDHNTTHLQAFPGLILPSCYAIINKRKVHNLSGFWCIAKIQLPIMHSDWLKF